jgi:hypothetical protein
MSDTKLKNTIQKAQHARELLEDPLMQEFILRTKAKYLAEFESSKLNDNEARENAWRKTQVLNDLLNQFSNMFKQGKDAEFTLASKFKQAIKDLI